MALNDLSIKVAKVQKKFSVYSNQFYETFSWNESLCAPVSPNCCYNKDWIKSKYHVIEYQGMLTVLVVFTAEMPIVSFHNIRHFKKVWIPYLDLNGDRIGSYVSLLSNAT